MKHLLGLSVLLLPLLVGFSTPSFSDNIFATTDDGKRVLLNPNGTWEYKIKNKTNNVFDSYSGELVNVSIIETKIEKISGLFERLDFVIKLKVSSNTPTSILTMKTHTIYGYENGSNIGGTMPVGFLVKDNFGNNMKVQSVSPTFIGFDEKGLRYGESKIFSIRPTETPLDASSYIVLEISQGVFGNKKPIELKIPTTDIVKN